MNSPVQFGAMNYYVIDNTVCGNSRQTNTSFAAQRFLTQEYLAARRIRTGGYRLLNLGSINGNQGKIGILVATGKRDIQILKNANIQAIQAFWKALSSQTQTDEAIEKPKEVRTSIARALGQPNIINFQA
jgi:hypothetical protein